MSGDTVRILSAVVALGAWSSLGLAQDEQPVESLDRIIERLEKEERQAREEGFVLESFKVRQPRNDPRRKSMKLSVGEVGDVSPDNPFGEHRSNYLLDPLTPREAPPVGLNLKLQF